MSPCTFYFNDRYCVDESATYARQRLSLGGRKWGHLAVAMLINWSDLSLLWDLTVKTKPLHLKRSLFFVCSVNFLTRLLFLPCKRPDSFSKNTAIRWGRLQGGAWVWNACACTTSLHAALCGSDSIIFCVVSTDFANQCTCTTCWLKPFREEVSGGHFSFFLFPYSFILYFKSSLSTRKRPTKYCLWDFHRWPFQTQVGGRGGLFKDNPKWLVYYAIFVGFFINLLGFKQQPVAATHNWTSCPEFALNLCCFQCWQGVRSSWFWSSARAWWCLWTYPCVAYDSTSVCSLSMIFWGKMSKQ